MWTVQLLEAGSYTINFLEHNIKGEYIMSINMATMGMFQGCCGTGTGGGAPPYRPYEQEPVTPFVLVKHVEIKTIKLNKKYEQIKVKLLGDGGIE